jgi:hypothetical protein
MNRVGSRHERNVRDLLADPVASAYGRRRISASALWERGFSDRIRALSYANGPVPTGGTLTAEIDVISSSGLERMNTAIKLRIEARRTYFQFGMASAKMSPPRGNTQEWLPD